MSRVSPNILPSASVSALHRISRLPIDTSDPGYPAFKLGAWDMVERYAVALVPLAERLIRTSPRQVWTLTSPPFDAPTVGRQPALLAPLPVVEETARTSAGYHRPQPVEKMERVLQVLDSRSLYRLRRLSRAEEFQAPWFEANRNLLRAHCSRKLPC